MASTKFLAVAALFAMLFAASTVQTAAQVPSQAQAMQLAKTALALCGKNVKSSSCQSLIKTGGSLCGQAKYQGFCISMLKNVCTMQINACLPLKGPFCKATGKMEKTCIAIVDAQYKAVLAAKRG